MITIDFATSPKGKRCIGMTMPDGTQWILLTARRAPIAISFMKELESNYTVSSLIGIPISWRDSLALNKLFIIPDSGVIGVYVRADQFDSMVDLFWGGTL